MAQGGRQGGPSGHGVSLLACWRKGPHDRSVSRGSRVQRPEKKQLWPPYTEPVTTGCSGPEVGQVWPREG